MLTVSDAQRRALIARRHGIGPDHRFPDIVTATWSMTALHATEAATPHVSLLARVRDVTVDDVERALYNERSVVKVMAMRRTLFVVPRDAVSTFVGCAGRRVASAERKRLLKDAVELTASRGERWIDDASAAVVAALAEREMSTRELRDAVPEFGGTIVAAPGTKWSAETPIMARLMTSLAAEGTLVRGRNGGSWRVSRPRFAAMATWLGEPFVAADPDTGYREVIRSWLHTFGPGTEADITWWLGSTKTAVRRALGELDVVEVRLDAGTPGWMLAEDVDDLGASDDEEPWVALLPVLDPTTMGWRARDFYLDPAHTPFLFDRAGNGGTTIWADGRIVGCWVQDDDGRPQPILMADISPDTRRLLDVELDRLDDFLGGERITNVFASPQMKGRRLS